MKPARLVLLSTWLLSTVGLTQTPLRQDLFAQPKLLAPSLKKNLTGYHRGGSSVSDQPGASAHLGAQCGQRLNRCTGWRGAAAQ